MTRRLNAWFKPGLPAVAVPTAAAAAQKDDPHRKNKFYVFTRKDFFDGMVTSLTLRFP